MKALFYSVILIAILILETQPTSAQVLWNRKITFSGREWEVASGTGGAGSNNWSDSPSSAWVDSNDKLHLKLRYVGSAWYSAELRSVLSSGYGMYRFYVDGRIDTLNKNVVFAPFLYAADNMEIDMEFSRWGSSSDSNAQYVLQPEPYDQSNRHRFPMNLEGTYSTHYINWTSSSITFKSIHGHYQEPPDPNFLIQQWTYSGARNPSESEGLRIHIQLRLINVSLQPSDRQEVEVIIASADLPAVPSKSITVTTPNGGENWQVGSGHDITWTASNIIDVKLEYTTDNGSSWILIGTQPNTGSNTWTIPDKLSTQCKVKISDVTDASINDMSNNVFTISSPPVLSVTPASQPVTYQAGTTTFSVSNAGTGTMNWTASSNQSWVTITSGTSGTNSGTITVSYTQNSSTTNTRADTITVTASGATGSPKQVTITQAPETEQDFIKVLIQITESGGSPITYELGIYHNATYCVDATLGENAGLPPQGPFDPRFVDPRGSPSCFGTGMYKDFRPYRSSTQIDTFQIKFGNNTPYPVTVSWVSGLNSFFTGPLKLVDLLGGSTINVNMFTSNSVSINSPITQFRIISQGPIITDVEELQPLNPHEYYLVQNYPNPFNPSTTIKYGLPHSAQITLSVYNTLGQRVALLVDDKQAAGYHEVTFDGAGLTSGVYFYRLQAGNPSTSSGRVYTETKKLLLLK